ncbi:MAG: LTA synthase family protein [Bacteroidales bacterium]
MDINKNFKDINYNISQTVKNNLSLQLQYILGVYLLALLFMMIYRFVNFAIHCFISFSDLNFILLIRSLLIGIRFDTIVLCWILAPFLVFMSLGSIFKINNKWFYRPIHLIICIIFIFTYSVIAIDLVYFSYFKSHINIIALSWVQSPSYILSLILRHPIYLVYLSIFMFSIAWYIWLMYCLYNATLFRVIYPYKQERQLVTTLLLSLTSIIFCCWGMYGRTTSNKPIIISSAYFSDSDFFNQLAVNPIFNLWKSIEEESSQNNISLAVLDNFTMHKIVKEQFVLKDYRPSLCPTLPPSTNIVIIMMENISLNDVNYEKMPYLSTISAKSLSFTNVYPDGENDYNGIFTTLFAYPNILSTNSMSSTIIPKFSGIPSHLAFKKYINMFFTSQPQKDDNTSRFLYRNNFTEIIAKKKINTKKEIEKISSAYTNFFACILHNSDTNRNSKTQTDNYIKDFIKKARKTSWFSKTVFVFVGSNGTDKIPFIIYMPQTIKINKNDNIASQTDIAPTLLSMIDNDYNNDNTLGLNIFADQRKFTISSYPHYAVCQDNTWKYIWRDSGKESLYLKNSDKNKINYIDIYSEQAQKMKHYLFAMLQYTQYSISQMKLQRK